MSKSKAHEIHCFNDYYKKIGSLSCHNIDVVRKSLGSTLIDGSSAISAARLALPKGHVVFKRLIKRSPDAYASLYLEREVLLSFIQNLVIFDRLYIDSYLLAFNPSLFKFIKKFKEIITPLHITFEQRLEIMEYINKFFPEFYNAILKAGEIYELSSVKSDIAEAAYYNRIGEKYYYKDEKTGEYFLYKNTEFPKNSVPYWLPRFLRDTSNPGTRPMRTAFYIALAKLLKKPLSPHPFRAPLVAELLRQNNSVANNIIQLFENKVIDKIINDPNFKQIHSFGLSLPIPLVGEFILHQIAKGGEPLDIIYSVRTSKSAKRFRELCRKLENALRLGPEGLRDVQKITKKIKELFKKWSVDLDEEIRYRTRKISIGFSKNVFNLNTEITFKDPIIWSNNSDLFFLNDMLRATRLDKLGVKLDHRVSKKIWEKEDDSLQ